VSGRPSSVLTPFSRKFQGAIVILDIWPDIAVLKLRRAKYNAFFRDKFSSNRPIKGRRFSNTFADGLSG